VKLHGGELVAFNRFDGGATIRMKLPLVESSQADEANGVAPMTLRGAETT
jgi:hypothetical protein